MVEFGNVLAMMGHQGNIRKLKRIIERSLLDRGGKTIVSKRNWRSVCTDRQKQPNAWDARPKAQR
jgi:transcriptional regulator with GAF, ATPase, and Fis domain